MRINVNVSDELNNWLEERSSQIGVAKSAIIAIALQELKENTERIQLDKYLNAITGAEIAMCHPNAEVEEIRKRIIAEKIKCEEETGYKIGK